MMNEILELLSSGKTLTVEAIGQSLNLAPAMVEAQIEFLEQAGYLHKIQCSDDCSGACSSCSRECGGRQGAKNPAAVSERTLKR